MALWMVDHYQISKNRAFKCVLLCRSMYFSKHHRRDGAALKMRIGEIANTRIRYGFRRIFTLLRREGFTDNHKRVYRIYRAEGLNLRSKRPRRNPSPNLGLERMNHQPVIWTSQGPENPQIILIFKSQI
jgi:putative transposase